MKDKQKKLERRAFRRTAVSLPVIYDITIPPFKQKLKIRARTKDISEAGIGFVASNKPDSLVANLQIELPPKGKSSKSVKQPTKFINIKAKIVYSKPITEEYEDILASGAYFVKISKKDAILLKKLIAKEG